MSACHNDSMFAGLSCCFASGAAAGCHRSEEGAFSASGHGIVITNVQLSGKQSASALCGQDLAVCLGR